MRPLSLESIVVAVLALTAGGCCTNVPEEPWVENVDGLLEGSDLTQIRARSDSNEDRCAAACVRLNEDDEFRFHNIDAGDITSCVATGVNGQDPDTDNPFDPAYDQVMIDCRAEGSDPGFCTGRRPLGHREAELAVDSVGAWFAVHAHLEGAAVTAFEQLAGWLDRRGAPAQLVERCLAAQADERDHARRMATQAEAFGASVPATAVDPAPEDLASVALHNAVEGCVAEAFAALIAAHQAEHAGTPELRELFGILAQDELRHGQLAWDLHTWLHAQLDEAGRAGVELALAEALAELPQRARAMAAATPIGLGWPDPDRAASLARQFAHRVQSASPLSRDCSDGRPRRCSHPERG